MPPLTLNNKEARTLDAVLYLAEDYSMNKPALLTKEIGAQSEYSALREYKDLLKKVATYNVSNRSTDGSETTSFSDYYNIFNEGVERKRLRSAGTHNGRTPQTARYYGPPRGAPKQLGRKRPRYTSPSSIEPADYGYEQERNVVHHDGSLRDDASSDGNGVDSASDRAPTSEDDDFQDIYNPHTYDARERPRQTARYFGPPRGNPVALGGVQHRPRQAARRGSGRGFNDRYTTRYSGPHHGGPRII